MVMTTLAGCGNSGGKPAAKVDTSEAAQGKVLNIYCWNQEFQERFEYFKKSGKLPSDVRLISLLHQMRIMLIRMHLMQHC